MAFNNFPYTNFQDLNLGWILRKMKQVEEAAGDVASYDSRITDAANTANQASATATQANSTANQASATANQANATANQASATATQANSAASQAVSTANQAMADASEALEKVGGAIGSYEIVVTTQNLCYHGTSLIDAVDIMTAILAGRDVFVIRDDPTVPTLTTSYKLAYYELDNSTNPATTIVYFDRLISYAGENATVERMVVLSGSNTATFNTVQTLASKSYVDSHGGGGTTSGAVLYDTQQSLTDVQKSQARDNIGAVTAMTNIPITLSNGVYSTTMTTAEILNHLVTNGCCIAWNGLYFYPAGGTYSGPFGALYFECVWPASSQKAAVSVFQLNMNGADTAPTIQRYARDININGSQPYIQVANRATYNLPSNTLVEFTGDSTSLSISLAVATDTDITHEYHFIFHSGSTPTTLTLPNTVRQPDGFTVEANHVYEVSILNNNMTAQGWAVTA